MDDLTLAYHKARVAEATKILKRRWVVYPPPMPHTINGDGFESIPSLEVYEDLWKRAGLTNPLDVNWLDSSGVASDEEYLTKVIDILEDQLLLCKYDDAVKLHPVHTAFCVFVECFRDLYKFKIGSFNLSAIN